MKVAFFSLLLLIPINCYIINKYVTLDEALPASLSTSLTIGTYFHTYVYDFNYSYVYFSLSDNSYGLKNISYCISSTISSLEDDIVNCKYIPLESYDTKTSGNTKDYFYKVDISYNTTYREKKYVYIKYSGSDLMDSLIARCSFTDLSKYSKTSNSTTITTITTTTSLPPYSIALHVICTVLSLTTLIVVIVFVCKIKKSPGGFGNDNFPLVQNNNSE